MSHGLFDSLVILLTSVTFAATAVGEFQISLPDSWKVSRADDGFVAEGPAAAQLRVSSYVIKGGTKDPEGARAARNVKDAAFEAVAELVREGTLVEQMPPTEKRLNAAVLYESLYTSSDARGYLAMYVLSGRMSVLVVSVEGDAREVRQILDVRTALVDAGGGAEARQTRSTR